MGEPGPGRPRSPTSMEASVIDNPARRLSAHPDNWWTVDREILDCLARYPTMTLTELSRQLHLSEGEATSLLAELAREGRIRIREISLAA
jgi:IclR helix-turn-helix domain